MARRLGYLSGAPRVTTRPEAVLSGPRAHVLGVMRAFDQLGWEVEPFIVGDGVPLSWVAEQQREDALKSHWPQRFAADIVRLLMSMVNGRRALREIGSVDWVYERFGSLQALGWWFQRRGIPWILETNALLFAESARDRGTIALASLVKTAEVWAYKKCDALVCVSQALAELAVSEAGVDPRKVVVVPNGVDIEHFTPQQYVPKRLFDAPTLGFVGSLNSWHRLDLLIEALTELREEGTDYKLVVVGDGPMRQTWEAVSHSLKQNEHIHFVGRIPWSEVPAYIAGFDLGYAGQVSPSIGKMYLSPLKLYEYAAMARPVVASAFDDAQRLIEGSSGGYPFPPGNKEELKSVLRSAYTQQGRWAEMGERARKLVIDQHSWVARVGEMISRVEPILEEKYGAPYPARRDS